MSNILDVSKSTLGKLLAAENIRIEHKQVAGPSFDVKNRVLVLPMWKSVDADLYDLMIGHEVGHALFTPADGWVDKVQEYGKSFKTMLNLVEDARIEKKMKRKYPGLRKPMYNGYTTLVERGFFGVSWDDMNSLPFADRLNIYFKLGPRSNVSFSEKEQDLVNRIENAETWDEVMALAKELHDVASKDAQDMSSALDDLIDAMENGEFSDDAAEGGDSGDGDPIEDVIERLRAEGKDELADRLEQASEKALRRMRSSLESSNGEPTSITSDAMEQNQHKLVDEKAMPNYYISFPRLDVSKWVVPARIVHQLMTFPTEFASQRDSVYNDFMSSNKRYISYLVKEFELRRNAAQIAKAKTSKTGELDMDKMWRHKLSEDLFLQTTVVPNGKNHGMVMMIDLSSSMVNNMAGTIEQLVTMALFCRKVNIPFDVYGFSDNGAYHQELTAMNVSSTPRPNYWDKDYDSYEAARRKELASRNDSTKDTLQIANYSFRLKQLLHYKMKAAEFTDSVKNLLLLAEAYRRSHSYYGSLLVPPSMELSGTPLNEAILVLREVAEKFKEESKVEVFSTIILTDGDASYGLRYRNDTGSTENFDRHNFILEDKKSRHQVKLLGRYMMTESLLEMYQHLTGSRMIGFYLMSGSNYRNEVHRRAVHSANFTTEMFEKQYKEQFGKNRYFGITGLRGYDVYFMMPGRDLEIEDVNMDKVMTEKGTLLKAFKKMQNTKMVSRVFLNQFIKQVA